MRVEWVNGAGRAAVTTKENSVTSGNKEEGDPFVASVLQNHILVAGATL